MRINPSDNPKFLYKYRRFDKYAFDMLEGNYVFLCKARDLDDPTECDAFLDVNKYYDYNNDALRKECIPQLLEVFHSLTPKENHAQIENILCSCEDKDGTIRPNLLLEHSFELQDMMYKGVNIAPAINFLRSFPDKLEEPQIKARIEIAINILQNAKEKIGICSLSLDKNNPKMWKEYASTGDKCDGYCIEYDFTEYSNKDVLYPVIYVSEGQRNTDILKSLVALFTNDWIEKLSDGQIPTYTNQCIDLLRTKDKGKWSYQSEWRIIDKANEKLPAPKIRAIYVGKDASKESIDKLMEFSAKRGINIIRQN